MKITKIIAAAAICLLFVFAACDFSAPEKLRIKASPQIDVGSTDFSLASYLSIEKMRELMGGANIGGENENDSEIQIFDYRPSADDSLMQYAVRYPVFKEVIPLDFMSAFDFDEKLGESVNMEFEVPSADEYINKLEKSAEFYVPESKSEKTYNLEKISELLPSGYECTSTISIGDVGMTFSEGSVLCIQIDKVVPESLSASYTLTLNSIRLSCAGQNVAELNGSYDLTRSAGNRLNLDVGGRKLQGDVAIDISVTTSGGKELNAENSRINLAKMTMNVSAENAKIAYLHDVKVAMDEDFKEKLSNDLSMDMPESMTQWIERAEGTACVAIDLENKLPDGMDIDITLTSGLLAIQDTKSFPAGEKTEEKYESTHTVTINPQNGGQFDLKLDMKLTGYDESANEMTFEKIEPGTKITLDGTVSCTFDFDELKLIANQSYSGSYPSEGEQGLDLSALGDFLPEGLTLASVPVYVYMSSPVLEQFDSIKDSVTGFVKASYTSESEGAKTCFLIGTEDGSGEIQFETPPQFSAETETLEVDLARIPCSGRTEFAEIVNSSPADLAFSYEFNLGTIDLQEEDLELLADSDLDMEMCVDLVIVLPLELKAESADSSGGVLLNINEFAGIEENISDRSDLFGRGSADEETDDIRDIIHGLKSLGIKLTCHDMMFSSGASSKDVKIILKQDTFEKELSMPKSGEKSSVSFKVGEVDEMLDLYPFFPDVSLFIPDGTWKVPRDAKINLDIGISADIDMEYSL
ncbi:MAG: hypothetical protein NC041_02315 [Bacteroides sp.]|nr:hypothetical protein [Prevotella sp.]MCM1407563.1 hypothetical protein [Treponema brennaborense]MCM1469287.1 hypothetical protein [Bacteroides sp.]